MNEPNVKNDKIDYFKLKDFDSGKLELAIRKKELQVPKDKIEREKFLFFSTTKVGSKEREEFFSKNFPQSPTPPEPPKVADVVVPKAEEPKPPEQPKVDPPKPVENKPAEQPKVENSSMDDLNKLLREESNRYKNEAKRHRDANARLGNELNVTKKRLEELSTLVSNNDKKLNIKPEKPTPPEIPVPPDPNEFTDGVLDDNWKKEQAKYIKQMSMYNLQSKDYNSKMQVYLDSLVPTGYEELKKEIQNLKPQVEEAYRSSQDLIVDRQKSGIDKEWDRLWNHTEKIQEKLNIKTKIPVRTINDYALIAANKDSVDANGNKVYSVDDVASANVFLSKLSPEDRDNYDRINKIIQASYDFSDGIPKEKYNGISPDLALSAAIDYAKNNLGLQIETLKIVELDEKDKKIELARRQSEQENKATPMPASQIGVNDKSIEGSTVGFEKKIERLTVLINMAKTNPSKFWNDPTNKPLQDEYKTLKREYLAEVDKRK